MAYCYYCCDVILGRCLTLRYSGCTFRYWYWRNTGITGSGKYTGEVLGVLEAGSTLAKYWEYWKLAVYWRSTGSLALAVYWRNTGRTDS